MAAIRIAWAAVPPDFREHLSFQEESWCMRIAQVAPLYESVPPRLYGGTERVVHYLTEELVRQSHDVTLFASGDSRTSARLVPVNHTALRLDSGCQDPLAHHIVLLERVFREAAGFDVLHFHIDYMHFPLSRRLGVPQLTTLHGRLDLPDLVPLYQEFSEMPVVSISRAQQAPLPWLNWLGTVYHGLPLHMYRASLETDAYLAFLGRISPEKGIEQAIEIARRSGLRLKIAAKVDKADREYYDACIRPLLDPAVVEFLGEITDREKQEFLGRAMAFVFAINWPEPFGLAMIESMACGTPVVAFRSGSVPEVVDDGVTGFIVETVEQAAEAIQRVGKIDRLGCRRRFEQRFSAERMARDYLALYERVLAPVSGRAAVLAA